MRYGLIVLWMVFCSVTSAFAQVSIGIGFPGVSIGINLPLFPELVPVPGYPVYYAPRLDSNYFFYDGMYWVYQRDNWYASTWYNGPWGLVEPEGVPLFVLRIPVRYYRNPPVYFRDWRADAPPRWGDHWGRDWEQRRSGWDRWDRKSASAPAPLPVYQRQYSGDRYPQAEQQQAIRRQNYNYQPRDPVVQQHYQEKAVQKAPPPSRQGQQGVPQERSSRQPDIQRSNPPQPPQRAGEDVQRSAPIQAPPQQRGQAVEDRQQQPRQGSAPREQQSPRSSQENVPQGNAAAREPAREQAREQAPRRGQGQDTDRGKGEERGQERNR